MTIVPLSTFPISVCRSSQRQNRRMTGQWRTKPTEVMPCWTHTWWEPLHHSHKILLKLFWIRTVLASSCQSVCQKKKKSSRRKCLRRKSLNFKITFGHGCWRLLDSVWCIWKQVFLQEVSDCKTRLWLFSDSQATNLSQQMCCYSLDIDRLHKSEALNC